jgi:predicted DNA binding CopG/RHH family protein
MKKNIKLTKEEKEIEQAIGNGEYVSVGPKRFKEIAEAIKARQKNSVLTLRVNTSDLERIKHKAAKLGVKYQSFISELIHDAACS